MMKCAVPVSLAATFLAVGCSYFHGGRVEGVRETVISSADNAQFKEVIPGVSRAVLWGDPEKGPYGAFTRFAPGAKHALHTHSNDLKTVVLKGAYIYTTTSGEKRVGPGSYFLIPGGVEHTSSSDPTEGCLFYESSSGKFDLDWVQGEPAKK